MSITLEQIKLQRYPAALLEHCTGLGLSAVLAVSAVLVHGYHPYAEDGGLYLAGIKHLLNPHLFPYGAEFVTAHLKFSVFAPLVAMLVRESSLSLMTVMLILYVLSFWMTLFAGWQIASRCYESIEARSGAVALLAACLTMPIAGTSLMLMDPYVSARSISTPCGLLAIMSMLDIRQALRSTRIVSWRSIALCSAMLIVAGTTHPLMGVYAFGCVLLLACDSFSDMKVRVAALSALCSAAIVTSACLYWLTTGMRSDYAQVARTRTYWFLDMWRWYEVFGLVAPLMILAVIAWPRPGLKHDSARSLARMSILAGLTSLFVACLFARTSSSTYLVAKLQPLRIFQMVYVFMTLAIGAVIGQRVLRRNPLRWMTMLVLIAGIMFVFQRKTYSSSAHLEFPWQSPSNGWERGFLWIRSHTPEDAVFALDANYVTAPGEDAQYFRAIAERSVLPDYSKDGGVAAITPGLTRQWVNGQTAQTNLDGMSDMQRVTKLRSTSASWVVLSRESRTQFECDYANDALKVCRLPAR